MDFAAAENVHFDNGDFVFGVHNVFVGEEAWIEVTFIWLLDMHVDELAKFELYKNL